MEEYILGTKKRVLKALENKGVTREKFFQKIGMTYSNFTGKAKETPLNSLALGKILLEMPDVSPDWLLTGRGSMYRSEGGAVQSVNGNGNTSVQGSGRVKVAEATQSPSELQKCKEEVERLHERLKEANESVKTAMEAVKLLANKNV